MLNIFGLGLNLESFVNLKENYVVCKKMQTVPDTRETWSYTLPENHVALNVAAMDLYMVQRSCCLNVRGVDKECTPMKGQIRIKFILINSSGVFGNSQRSLTSKTLVRLRKAQLLSCLPKMMILKIKFISMRLFYSTAKFECILACWPLPENTQTFKSTIASTAER